MIYWVRRRAQICDERMLWKGIIEGCEYCVINELFHEREFHMNIGLFVPIDFWTCSSEVLVIST